jgi:ATP/ADP translocase
MTSLFDRLFHVQRSEFKLVLILGMVLFGNSFVLEVDEIIATSGFLSQVSVENILPIWTLSMGVIIISATLQAFIVDRFDHKSVLWWLCLAMTVIYVLLGVLFQSGSPGWVTYSLLFLLSDQQWLFFPLIFWVLANDLFRMAQSKRLFPLIISMGFLGQLSGIALSTTAPDLLSDLNLSSSGFLGINAVIFSLLSILIWCCIPLTNRSAAPTQAGLTSVRKTLNEGWEFVRNIPSFRFMCIAYLGLAIAITVARFHFLALSNRELHTSSDLQTFYGIYRLLVVSLSIIMTGLVMSRLMKWLRLQDVFLITPAGVTVVIFSMLLVGGLVVGMSGMIVIWIFYNSVDQSARKALQALIPEERRGRVSLFTDSYIPATGVIIAAVAINAVVGLMPLADLLDAAPLYLSLGVIAVLLSIWSVLKLRQVYDSSLLNWRMNRRRRGSTVLEQLE